MGEAPRDDVTDSDVEGIDREVAALRARTEEVFAELQARLTRGLDRARLGVGRVRRVADMPARLRARPVATFVAGVILLGAASGLVALLVRRARRQHTFGSRMRRRAHGWRQLLADPERALRPSEPLGTRLLKAAILTAATALVRQVATSAAQRAIPSR